MSARPKLPPPPPGLLRDASLFLDLDGTLVEIAQRPEAVVIEPRLRQLLQTIVERLRGRVAILSGRDASQVRQLMTGLPLHIGGSHGLEIEWTDGRRSMPMRPAALDVALREMSELQRRHPDLLVENKPLGVALHYRRAPGFERECRELMEKLAATSGLPVQLGKMVFELKAGAGDKGDALRTFMADPLMSGAPVFIGDDMTDEAGFKAARDLGGAGILVGDPRPTAAMYGLSSVQDVAAWLEQALEQL